MLVPYNGRGGIAVTAHVLCAEGLWFESDSRPRLNARSLFTQQRMGTCWQHWGDRGGEERSLLLYDMPMAQHKCPL